VRVRAQTDLDHIPTELAMRVLSAAILATSLAFTTSAFAMCCGGEKSETKAEGKMQSAKGQMKLDDGGSGSDTSDQSQGSHAGEESSDEKAASEMKKAGGCCCDCCGGKKSG
jgi:hypothetical protein